MKKQTIFAGVGLVASVSVLLAGIGLISTTSSSAAQERAMPKMSRLHVASVSVDKMAQMVQAAPRVASTKDEATFVLTAKLMNGKPAANQTVSFYIGPMKPLSNVSPKAWYESGTKAAARYIAKYSARTDAKGQAEVVLYGQPTDSMEMVGVRVGDLTSFSTAAKHAIGSLDAWWTTASTMPTAPVGDYVTVSPFLTTAKAMGKQVLTVGVFDKAGKPLAGAHVQIIVKNGASSKMSGSASGNMGMSVGSNGNMAMGASMTASAGLSLTTNQMGEVMTKVSISGKAAVTPVRIVVTQPAGKGRIAGGMNAEFVKG